MERLEIPRDAVLDGKNYTDWKMIVISVLEQHNMENIVFKSDSSLVESAEMLTKTKAAKTFLLFAMNREHRNKLSHAYQIWSSIANIYENKSKRGINTLWKRLFNFRINSPDQISQGISEMQTIASGLRARQINVDDSCLIGCIVCPSGRIQRLTHQLVYERE